VNPGNRNSITNQHTAPVAAASGVKICEAHFIATPTTDGTPSIVFLRSMKRKA
jgi:hypothetical protein